VDSGLEPPMKGLNEDALDARGAGELHSRERTPRRHVESRSTERMICPNGCSAGACPLQHFRWIEVARIQNLTRQSYLKIAAERVPFIWTDAPCGDWGWKAVRGRWSQAEHFLNHPDVLRRRSEEDAALLGFTNWEQTSTRQMSAHAALELLCSRKEALPGSQGSSERFYMSAWEYDPPVSPDADDAKMSSTRDASLAEDVMGGVPFMQCLLETSRYPGVQALSKLLRWVYIGEKGTACATHSDPLASHAWMWLATGQKEWRFLAHPAGEVDPADPTPLQVNLFSCQSVAQALKQDAGNATLYWATVKSNDLLFVPSMVWHAVRNAGNPLTIAVSHNFIDVACLPETLRALHTALDKLCSEMVASEEQQGEHSLDEALETLTGRLDAPLFALLSIATACPEGIEEIVSRATTESDGLSTHEHEAIVSRWEGCRCLIQKIRAADGMREAVDSEG